MLVELEQLHPRLIAGATDILSRQVTDGGAASMALAAMPSFLLLLLVFLVHRRAARRNLDPKSRFLAVAKLCIAVLAVLIVLSYGHGFVHYPSTNEIALTAVALVGFGLLYMAGLAALLLIASTIAAVFASIIGRRSAP